MPQPKVESPFDSMKHMRSYRAPELYLLERDDNAETRRLFDGVAIEGWGFGEMPDDFLRYADGCANWFEYVTEQLYPEYAGHDIDEGIYDDEELLDTISDFVDKPDVDVAAGNPVLSVIPDVTAFARRWRSFSRASVARQLVHERTPRMLLHHEGSFELLVGLDPTVLSPAATFFTAVGKPSPKGFRLKSVCDSVCRTGKKLRLC